MAVLICCWSLVSFYKSVFDFLKDDVLDFLDFLGFDDDVLEDTDLSLVSFYKSVLMMKFDDVLDFLGFDDEV
ncbi:hypothetical protein Hanom_Chr05g00448161 [Helianthus anomalus]